MESGEHEAASAEIGKEPNLGDVGQIWHDLASRPCYTPGKPQRRNDSALGSRNQASPICGGD